MLYDLIQYFDPNGTFPGARLFQYVSFRSALAIITSLLISIVWGDQIINKLRSLQIGESIRDLGLEGQKEKEGTPTMGGVIIVLSIVLPCLLFTSLGNVYIQMLLVSVLWMAFVGGVDDYIKVFKKNKEGLQSKFKIMGQVLLGIFIGLTMFFHDDVVIRVPLDEAKVQNYPIVNQITLEQSTGEAIEYAYVKTGLTNFPFFKDNNLNYRNLVFFAGDNADKLYWIFFIPFVIFIITAVSNAANLTDGIDGLAAGISAIIAITLAIFAYVSSNALFADYLDIMFLPKSQEVVVFTAALIGACVGFLWHNSYPARVFMGDTGSLALGGVIGALCVILRKEVMIPVICGVFFIEALSVTLQVSYFKYTKRKYGEGRRIFRMSPLHHHYQKMGMHESKIVTRFWIVGIILAIVAIVTLKIR
jgi:phospho-N-acetylmuramoyl-pentapeptide-transferase